MFLQPFSELGPQWAELFLTYGEGEEGLGTAPGGEGLMLGPEYGTQTPDGNFWILDAAKQRVAVFDSIGRFQFALPLPEEVLVDGQYFQFQMPQALDDGSVAAGGFRTEETMALLRIVEDEITSTEFPGSIPWVTTDGTYLYGLADTGDPYRLDPNDPVASPVDSLLTRCGTPYNVHVEGDRIVFSDFPRPGMSRTLEPRFSEDPAVPVHAGIEVESGIDGSLFILFTGAPESDETVGVGGFVQISPDGVVGEAEAVRDPFSPADPGSPAHLGVTPKTSTPWLMAVDEDGVRIYVRGV